MWLKERNYSAEVSLGRRNDEDLGLYLYNLLTNCKDSRGRLVPSPFFGAGFAAESIDLDS